MFVFVSFECTTHDQFGAFAFVNDRAGKSSWALRPASSIEKDLASLGRSGMSHCSVVARSELR